MAGGEGVGGGPIGWIASVLPAILDKGSTPYHKKYEADLKEFVRLCFPKPGETWPADRFGDCQRWYLDLTANLPRYKQAKRRALVRAPGRAAKLKQLDAFKVPDWPPVGVEVIEDGETIGQVDPFGTNVPRNPRVGTVMRLPLPKSPSQRRRQRSRSRSIRLPPLSGGRPGTRIPGRAGGIAGAVIVAGQEILRGYEKWKLGRIKAGGARLPQAQQERLKRLGGVRGVNRAIRDQMLPKGPPRRATIPKPTTGVHRPDRVATPQGKPQKVPEQGGAPQGKVEEVRVPGRIQRRAVARIPQQQTGPTQDTEIWRENWPSQPTSMPWIRDPVLELARDFLRRPSSGRPVRSPVLDSALNPLARISPEAAPAPRSRECECAERKPRKRQQRRRVRKEKLCFEV